MFEPELFPQLLQLLTLALHVATAGVVIYLQLRVSRVVRDTNAKVNGTAGAGLAREAAALAALAELDPSPAAIAAAAAAAAALQRHDSAVRPPPPK